MAVEAARGCGYRKVGGTYMVSGEYMADCDRLPFKLEVCPCCGEGYRPSRALRKITPAKMLEGKHQDCTCGPGCVVCNPDIILMQDKKENEIGHYLEWIGTGHYGTGEDFAKEARVQGISRRLKTGVPRELVVGKSVIFLAHRSCAFAYNRTVKNERRREIVTPLPAIFMAFVVHRLEHICTDKEYAQVQKYHAAGRKAETQEWDGRTHELLRMQHRGIVLVPVPHDDPDHK